MIKWFESSNLDEIIEALNSHPKAFVYKHSPRCGVSHFALRRLSEVPENEEELWVWIDVVGNRPLSLALADHLDVWHESPQLILLSHGSVLTHTSHNGVTEDTVAKWRTDYLAQQ